MNKALRSTQEKPTRSTLRRYEKFIIILSVALFIGSCVYGASAYVFNVNKKAEIPSLDTQDPNVKATDNPIESSSEDRSFNEPDKQTTHSSITSNNNSSGSVQFDGDGCMIGSSSYEVCRSNVFNAKCETDHRIVYNAYHASYNPVRASYDTDRAVFQQELDDLVSRGVYTKGQTYGIWNSFVHQRTQTFNAAVTPIYNTYVTAVDSLNAGGCKLYKYAIGNPTLPF